MIICFFLLGSVWGGNEIGENIALYKPYKFTVPPNYALCTDEGDTVQLTDGKFAPDDKAMWSYKEAVGWSYSEPTIIIDLGKVEPISGVSFRTAAGISEVMFPRAIIILVSDNGSDFYYAGELVSKSTEIEIPSSNGYQLYTFKTNSLKTKGRYVALTVIRSSIYIFCDEIEIYRGPKEYLDLSPGELVDDLEALKPKVFLESGIRSRINKDILTLRKQIAEADLEQKIKQELLAEVSALSEKAQNMESPPIEGFKAIMPLTDLHRDVYKLNAKLLRAQGYPPLAIWQNSRWDPLSPMEVPEKEYFLDTEAKMSMAMIQNEHRAEILNLSNTTDTHLKATVSIEGLPGGTNPDYISVHQVEFTGTREGAVIADALPLAKKTASGYEIDIPAGMTRQVWFSFNPKDIAPGQYQGYVRIKAGEKNYNVLLDFYLYPFSLPEQPSLSLGVWDYTDDIGRRYTHENVELAIENMRSHFVNSPWALPSTAPRVLDYTITGGKIEMAIDYSRFDSWISRWPNIQNYCIYLSVGTAFGPKGVRMNPSETSEFFRLVSHWAKEWGKHVQSLGIDPSQIYLLLVDEPQTVEADERIIIWGKAIKAGEPRFKIWEDPCWSDPRQATQEMFEVCDIICPNRMFYFDNLKVSHEFYEGWRQQGKQLWFYSCQGPMKLLDPYSYNRILAWIAWQYKAVGIGFWAYPDSAMDPWNDYISTGIIGYSPVYLDANSVTDGKHWEAVREGIQDYEYLSMLSNRVKELEDDGVVSEALNKAKELLRDEPGEVIETSGTVPWEAKKNRETADQVRVKILDLLMELM